MNKIIVEASLINQHKTLINQIKGYLSRNSKKNPVYKRGTWYRFNDKNYRANLRGEVGLYIKEIKIEEVSNNIYFLGVLDGEFLKDKWYFDNYTGGYNNRDKSDSEKILDFLKYYFNKDDHFLSGVDISTEAALMNLGGLSSVNRNTNNLDAELMKTKAYEDLLSHLEEVKSIDVKTILLPDVVKKLKERDNVIPLLWLDLKNYVLNYPYTGLRSSNLMSSSPRGKVNIDYFVGYQGQAIDTYCRDALVYTPYGKWLDYKYSDVSDVSSCY